MGSDLRKCKASLVLFVLLIICHTNTCSGAALLGHEKDANATYPCHGETCLSIGEELEELEDWEYLFMDFSLYSNRNLIVAGGPKPPPPPKTGGTGNAGSNPCGSLKGQSYDCCMSLGATDSAYKKCT